MTITCSTPKLYLLVLLNKGCFIQKSSSVHSNFVTIQLGFSNKPSASACLLAFNLKSAIELLLLLILSNADEPREAAAAELRQDDAHDKASGYGGG